MNKNKGLTRKNPQFLIFNLAILISCVGIVKTASANQLIENSTERLSDEISGLDREGAIRLAKEALNLLPDQSLAEKSSSDQLAAEYQLTSQTAAEKSSADELELRDKLAADTQLTSQTAVIPETSPTASPELGNGSQSSAEEQQPASVISNQQESQSQIPLQTPVRILSPQNGTVKGDTTNLVIQYSAETQVQVSINQKPIDPNIPTQLSPDNAENLTTQVWYNIPLEEGENTITVQTADGTVATLQLRREDSEIQIEISPTGDARVQADSRSTLQLEGRITDEKGELIRKDAVVTLTATAGRFVGADQDKDAPGFQIIVKAGEFTAQLQSSLDAQKVKIRAAVEATEEVSSPENRGAVAPELGENGEFIPSDLQPVSSAEPIEAYTQVEFITNLRPSLVSGVIDLRIGPQGTNFWGTRRDFLNPNLIDEGSEFDLDAAVFATGKIGEWLFTGAYNSERPLNQTCDGTTRLFREVQFCDDQYPVYGDSSTVDYLTPSTDSVFLRFERTSPVAGAEPDYVMWGDYSTTEFARSSQLYTATTRQLHGFKGSYNLGNLQVSAFFSPDVEGFQRDTIVPDGTSGYYFLSQRLLVEGSENVFVETEEINRPGTVLERKQLSRNLDYEIDYDRGTLFFRRPILATELDAFAGSRVRRIVVTYQHEGVGNNDETNIYAGRLQYNLSQEFDKESWVAASYLRENEGSQDFELYGTDFLVRLGENGQIVGEYAHSSNNSLFLGNVTGNAYRLEANGSITPGILGRAYYRSVEEGFANNATTSFTPGQTRYGAAVSAKLTSTTQLSTSYDHEVNFGISPSQRTEFFDIFNPQPEPRPGERVDNSLSTFRAGILQKIGESDLSLDYVNRSRDDQNGNRFEGDASQLVSRLNVPLTEALTFRAQNELNLGNDDDPLYPNRTTLGLDWAAYKGVTVRLAHQFYSDGLLGDNAITSLDTILAHQLGKNTAVTGRYSVISAFNDVRGQGAVGLNHRWTIAPGLRMNLGYEHIFSDTFSRTAAGRRFAQPYAIGQSASSLGLGEGDSYSVGLEYTDNPNFQASARLERRTGSGGSNNVISAAAAGKVSPSLTALVRYQQANASNQLLRGLGDTANLRFGLAYRNPQSDKFNALLSYEFRQNPSSIPETLLLDGSSAIEHLFALEAIYAPSWRWEFYGKLAMRNSKTYLSNDFSNSTTVSLGQLRATYRLGYRMDLAGEVRLINQSDIGYTETGFALETGYYLTPDLRAAVGYSFGSIDDTDFSGYRSEGGVYFGLTFKVNELFGGFGRQKVVPPQQQESAVETAAETPNQPSQENPAPPEETSSEQTLNVATNVVPETLNQLITPTEEFLNPSLSDILQEDLQPTEIIFQPSVFGGGETP